MGPPVLGPPGIYVVLLGPNGAYRPLWVVLPRSSSKGPKESQDNPEALNHGLRRAPGGFRGFQGAPRDPQEDPQETQIGQCLLNKRTFLAYSLFGFQQRPRRPHRSPKSSPEGPKIAQEGSTKAQESPKTAKETPKTAKSGPRGPQEAPKTAPRGPLEAPKNRTEQRPVARLREPVPWGRGAPGRA